MAVYKMSPYLPEYDLSDRTVVWIEMDLWLIEFCHGKSKTMFAI